MAFNLVYHSQNDDRWKNDKLGFGTGTNETIGYVGCALTSVAMLLSGYGYTENPKSLNQKLKNIQGFAGSGIRWQAVPQLYPQVKFLKSQKCENEDAPLGEINAALDAGRPVIVRVDAKPSPELEWHFVLIYARNGSDDYLMLDPWPYQPGTTKPDSLMKRYNQGRPLRRAIQQVVFYQVEEAGGPIQTPSSSEGTSAPPAQPVPAPGEGGVSVRVMDSVSTLRIRSSKDTSSNANVLTFVKGGTLLLLIDPGEIKRIGKVSRWVRVREPGGVVGFVDARYLEKVRDATPAPVDGLSAPAPETPAPTAPAEETKLTLVVSQEALGTDRLNLRKTASLAGAILKKLPAGTSLTVLESSSTAKAKLGKADKWIYVSEPGGSRGYVSAAYVRLP